MCDNAARGAEAERLVKARRELAGGTVEHTGRGSDYKVTRRNWFTGKKETTLVEVKTGNAKLSPLQKKRKRSWGKQYVVERLPGSPFSQPASGALSGGSKKARKPGLDSLLGSLSHGGGS